MENLHQSWLHSHEEDSGADQVYRPAEYQFPPSRGRHGFTLEPGGRLLAQGPSPEDKSETALGTWQQPDAETLVLQQHGCQPERYRIIELTAAKLVLRK